MVLLVATERIHAAWDAVPVSRRRELDLPAELDVQGPISHEQLLRLSRTLRHDASSHAAGSVTVLSALLRGTTVYVPPPPKKPEPTPEYLASKARLQAAADQAAYQRLLNPTHTPDPSSADPHASEAPTATEETLTPSLVLNIFLSVIVTGFSVYWALSKFMMPDILARRFASWTGPRMDAASPAGGASDAVRVLVSLFAALAVAVAEAFLYAAYLGKVERAKAKERRVKERKSVVETVPDAPAQSVDQEEETIWGKGVNGGMRRRVREKWEREKEQDVQ
ncbi:hypothetical protein N7492_008854 [Penicillium capsulatum]|uniref:Endoplasmic reticulum-based factor for assembly of V-ATPase-domain-containing protein n=1 Tax=Penicillium capsulatum TaxID=69766 RepID=A0A9W9HU99_9EURO|nr:hypothetical protein N7492_008854 [Penicillium capsulatum]KAJ6106256.1 hypothetical protein N7512_009773 [Penicillium capsulatum]